MPEGAEQKGTRKQETIRSAQQFRRVYAQGRRFSTQYFSAFILKNDRAEQRLGITVTRKIGSAVVRNRCKRRLREIFRRRDRSAMNSPGFDLVINVRPDMLKADYDRLQEALIGVLARFQEQVAKSASATEGQNQRESGQ
jgi:ribonuclease P protein component